MTAEEVKSLLMRLRGEIEWEYPLDYQIALDKATEALELYKLFKGTSKTMQEKLKEIMQLTQEKGDE